MNNNWSVCMFVFFFFPFNKIRLKRDSASQCVYMSFEWSWERERQITHRNEYDVYRTNVRVLLKSKWYTWISGTVYIGGLPPSYNSTTKRHTRRETMCVQCAAAYINISLCLHFTLCVYGNMYALGRFVAAVAVGGRHTERRWLSSNGSSSSNSSTLTSIPSTEPFEFNGILRIKMDLSTMRWLQICETCNLLPSMWEWVGILISLYWHNLIREIISILIN